VRRVRRKSWVSRNEHFWSAVIENQTVIASNIIRFSPIVAPTDWVVRAGQSTANLVRIRGHWSVTSVWGATPGEPGGSSVFYAIIVVDADDAANFNPGALVAYQEHRVLWTRTANLVQFGFASAGPIVAPSDSFAVDVKVQAKLKPDDYVYMVTANFVTPLAGDNSLNITGILRGLVVVK